MYVIVQQQLFATTTKKEVALHITDTRTCIWYVFKVVRSEKRQLLLQRCDIPYCYKVMFAMLFFKVKKLFD